MKVVGFTIARNVIKYDYPIWESIHSILPVCDQFLILVGESEDDTLNYLKSIDHPKIKIVTSKWNDTLNDGGKVLATETNKALQHIDEDADWCFYIQADEVIHEKYLETIKSAMLHYKNQPEVDGLLFKYHHFYHSFDYLANSSRFYRNEIRVIRNNKNIYSYRDAQGFRINDNEKLKVKSIDAWVYHYGWVRPPEKMLAKQQSIMKYFHNQAYINRFVGKATQFDYTKMDFLLHPFQGTHPDVMRERINDMDWEFDINNYRKTPRLKEWFKDFLYTYLSINLSYTNYTLLK